MFGCRIFPYLCDYAAPKLDPRCRPCMFLGYSGVFKGFLYHDLGLGRIFTARDSVFDELNFPYCYSSAASSFSELDVSTFLEGTPPMPQRSLPSVSKPSIFLPLDGLRPLPLDDFDDIQ